MTEDSVARLIAARADDTNVGLCSEDERWTWAEEVREAATRAAALQRLRRPRPFHVGVMIDNVPEFVFMLAGAALAGATIVGINSTRRGDALAADRRHTDCQFVLTDTALAGLVEGADLGTASDRVHTTESDEWQ